MSAINNNLNNVFRHHRVIFWYGDTRDNREQYALNIHSADISAMLKKLCENNFLESDNKGRWTTYKLASRVDTSFTKVDTSSHKVDTSNSKVDTSKSISSRMKRSDLEELIMAICKGGYVKMEEVAVQINRSIDYLKNRIFPDMIREGKLVRKYPHTQNHPEQAYQAKED